MNQKISKVSRTRHRYESWFGRPDKLETSIKIDKRENADNRQIINYIRNIAKLLFYKEGRGGGREGIGKNCLRTNKYHQSIDQINI